MFLIRSCFYYILFHNEKLYVNVEVIPVSHKHHQNGESKWNNVAKLKSIWQNMNLLAVKNLGCKIVFHEVRTAFQVQASEQIILQNRRQLTQDHK